MTAPKVWTAAEILADYRAKPRKDPYRIAEPKGETPEKMPPYDDDEKLAQRRIVRKVAAGLVAAGIAKVEVQHNSDAGTVSLEPW